MMCQKNCGATVTRALQALPNAVQAGAVFAEQRAWVVFSTIHGINEKDSGHQEAFSLAIEAIEDVGFDAMPRLDLHIEGMMCQANCGSTVQRALEMALSSFHIQDAKADFATSRAWVVLPNLPQQEQRKDYSGILQAAIDSVENVGFDARVWTVQDEEQAAVVLPSSPKSASTENDINETEELLHDEIHDDSDNIILLSVEGMSCAVCTGRVVRTSERFHRNCHLFYLTIYMHFSFLFSRHCVFDFSILLT